jgi:hypothetical protein
VIAGAIVLPGTRGEIQLAPPPQRISLSVLTGQERTNRLLLLMQLHANRQDDERAYTTAIRAWLQANHGRPRVARRAVTDRRGHPSLR